MTKGPSRSRVRFNQFPHLKQLAKCVLVNCWPTPSNDGTCEVSIEYELENESVTLYDLEIFIPLPSVIRAVGRFTALNFL